VTLIEMMIGLAIAIILFVLAVPNFSTFIQNTKIRNAADSIQSGLMLARAEAVRRNANVQFALSGTDSSWTVACETAVGDMDGDGKPDCPGPSPTATTPSYIQSRKAAEGSANVVIATSEINAYTQSAAATPVFSGTISFDSLGRVNGDSLNPGDNAIFTITGPQASSCQSQGGTLRCLEVEVTSAGQMRMCDPNLTVSKPSDPQAC